jgi:hypothetical protein
LADVVFDGLRRHSSAIGLSFGNAASQGTAPAFAVQVVQFLSFLKILKITFVVQIVQLQSF